MKLAPCPKCGNKMVLLHTREVYSNFGFPLRWFWYQCSECNHQAIQGNSLDRLDAARFWNADARKQKGTES